MTTLDDVLALVMIDSVSGNESALASLVYERLVAQPALDVERIGDNPATSHWRTLMDTSFTDSAPAT